MNIENLEYILEIYHSKSINKASKKLYISQPRLSLLVKKIEDEVGYRIFNRTNTGIVVTEQGEAFIKSAETVYIEYQKMRSSQPPATKQFNLAVSACYSSFLSAVFFEYKQKNPCAYAVQDSFRETSPNQGMDDVIANYSQLAAIYYTERSKKIFENYADKHGLVKVFSHEPFQVKAVVAAISPLAKQQSVTIEELQKNTLVTYDDLDFDMFQVGLGISKEMSVQFVSCRSSFYDAIRRNNCFSVSLDFAPGEAERAGCICLPLKNGTDYYLISIFSQAGYELNPREKGFIRYLQEQLKVIAPVELDGFLE